MKTTLKLKKSSTNSDLVRKTTEIKKSDKSVQKHNPYFPTRYSIFKKNYNNYQIDLNASVALMRFIYRYRFAKLFKSINYKDPKFIDKTMQSYEACNGLFLAYTAFEAVRSAAELIGLSPKFYDSLEIDPINAVNFRRNEKFILFMNSIAKNEKQKKDFDKFFRKDAPSNDILGVIYMIRNAFSHGSFTPRGCGLDKKHHIDDITFLTERLLDHANIVFVEVVERCQQTLKVEH
jgi:hypothetical protein